MALDSGYFESQLICSKFCPMLKESCIKEQCAWWLSFANDCALPVATGILADSTISRSW